MSCTFKPEKKIIGGTPHPKETLETEIKNELKIYKNVIFTMKISYVYIKVIGPSQKFSLNMKN